jgi:CBS domain-containing protein
MQVRDVMHREVLSVAQDTPLEDAARLMLGRGISGLPVVDGQGALLGIVTEGDFLRRAELGTERQRPRWLEFLTSAGRLAGDYVGSHGRAVSEVMTAPVETIDEGAPLQDAVAVMLRRHIKRLPVVADGKLVGIVSRADLLRAFAERAAIAAAPLTDAEIAARVRQQLDAQPWGGHGQIGAEVTDGVVTMSGTVTDERTRTAARVLAENVPGVKRVVDRLVWIEPLSGTVIDAPAAIPRPQA